MSITKKKFNEAMTNINENVKKRFEPCQRDIGLLEKEVFGLDRIGSFRKGSRLSQAIEKLNEHTHKLNALMKHFKLEFKKALEYEIVQKKEK